MGFMSRGLFLALCAALAWQSPAMARAGRGRRVLGVVAQTDRAHIDNTAAVLGADIYSCDRLDTDADGVLRVRVGSSQLFLAGLSSAALEDEGSTIQVIARGGTVGFSTAGSDGFSMRTPAGVLRATSGQAASGQVTFASAHELVISAIHGDLTLDTGGEFRTIPEGRSANVTFANDIDNGCHEPAAANQTQNPVNAPTPKGMLFTLGGVAGFGLGVYFIWQEMMESDSKPKP